MTKRVFQHEEYDIRKDGSLVLYKRPSRDGSGNLNPVFQIRIQIPNVRKEVRLSTGKRDQSDAIRWSLEKYDELYGKSLIGQDIFDRGFKKTFKEFCEFYPDDADERPTKKNRPQYLEVLKRHPYEFFVREKKDISIASINNELIQEYFSYRRKEHKTSNNTLRREHTHLNTFFRFCVKKKYLSAIPKIKLPPRDKIRRETWTLDEYRTIVRKMRRWVTESPHPRTKRQRYLFQQYFLLMSNSGARVGEMRDLRWGEVRQHEYPDGIRMIATLMGKTGKRECVFNIGCEEYFKNVYLYRCDETNRELLPEDEPIFCNYNGTPIGSFKKSFLSLMDYCGTRTTTFGENRTIYSLRHFYAHQRLQNQIPVWDIASNMGTSVDLIMKHYGDRDNVSRGETITQDLRRRPKRDQKLPWV